VQYRSLAVLTPPTTEPVTLNEAKAHCRVDTRNDDAYILGLITAAREWCESFMDETIPPTQYVMRLDAFPVEFDLPRPPMVTTGTATAVSITYTLTDQTTATLDETQYRVDRESRPCAIRTLYGGTWPSHLFDPGSVSVSWWGGRTTVSQRVRSAILLLVAHLYEHRMAAQSQSINEVPFGVKAMLNSAKWGSYK